MEIFEACRSINDSIISGDSGKARNELLVLLDYHYKNKIAYSPLVNHLIREVGLYPYLQYDNAFWSDRFVYEAFKVDVGLESPLPLHREQSGLLKRLIAGDSLAISAPTSFGKSFVIDAYISIKRPNNVVIIVPTIALTDETRRRIYLKFSSEYKIITTSEVELGEKNIFIFPQERALNYVSKIKSIDILIVDEFYKASEKYDSERAPSLIRAIIKLGDIAKQKYFLAPNISELNENPFTKGMDFVRLNFNTVYLQMFNLYKSINKDEGKKSAALLNILKQTTGKSLIYAGTYSNIDKVSNLLISSFPEIERPLLASFASWLGKNYELNWSLTNLVKRGTGIHNGNLHRSLSQIQIKLFEDPNGINNIVSTSSIIEGVNTSAENVIIWRNKVGQRNLNDFTYKNIIGRGGRMFRHFVGKIYVLEKPPENEDVQLSLDFPEEILGDVDDERFKNDLTEEQLAKIISYREEMSEIIGKENFSKLQRENAFQSGDFENIKQIANDLNDNPDAWNGLSFLNSPDVNNWDRLLLKIIYLKPGGWDTHYRTFIEFVKIISNNWTQSIPQMLTSLDRFNVGIDLFFRLERNVAYKFASLLNDVNILQSYVLKRKGYDITPFVSKLSHAFLPTVVYQLEEYGLPRMISRKIHDSKVLNFENQELTIHGAISEFNSLGLRRVLTSIKGLDKFDKYILEYFFDGIQVVSRG